MRRRRRGLLLAVVLGVLGLGTAGVLALLAVRTAGEVVDPGEPLPAPAPFGSDTATASEGPLGGLLDGLDLDAAMLACAAPGGDLAERGLPDDLVAAIEVIAERVAAERELDFTAPVEPELLTAAELAERVAATTAEGYTPEDADVDARVLTALGALAPGTDLRALVGELLAEQVAGFYDPDSGTLVSLAEGDLDVLAQLTLAHELDHALVDQALGLPELGVEGDSDASLAALAVVEGDATLLMQRYLLRHLTMAEMFGALGGGGLEVEQEALAAAPYVLQQQLVFPYVEGLEFVCGVWAEGGWAAVDALHREPPITSAQVLFPERHRAAEGPVDAADPGDPGGDWIEVRSDTLGAADLLWLFSAPGDAPSRALSDPLERASAWAGGELVAWTRGADTAVGISLVDRGGATLLCSSVTAWWGAAFPGAAFSDLSADGVTAVAYEGERQAGVITCEGDEVRVGVAPDVAVAAVIAGAP